MSPAAALAVDGPPCTNANIFNFAASDVVIDFAVQAAQPVPHCNVYGRISPNRTGVDGKTYNIGFNLRLPDNWNRRLVMLGTGGTAGSIPTTDPFSATSAGAAQLSQGYAITSNDSGHEDLFGFGPNPTLVANPNLTAQQDDSSGGTAHFGVDPQARIDYGYNATGRNGMVAKAIVRHFYRQPARYSYFSGCSNGGREGFVASQRYPDLFDGIVAKSPGFDLPRAAVAEAWNQQALLPLTAGAPTDPTTNPPAPYFGDVFSTANFNKLAEAVNAACDKLDGAADGMVNNFLACTTGRVAKELRKPCSGEGCLTNAQIGALLKIVGGPRNSKGQQLYAFDQYYGDGKKHSSPRLGPDYRAFPWDPGIGAGWPAWMMRLFPSKPVNTALNLTLGGGALPMIFVTPPEPLPVSPAFGGDARADYVLSFDFDRDAPKIFAKTPLFRQSSVDFMTGASTDLSDFRRRGGKMIVSHGTADGVFSITDTARWYNALLRKDGKRTDDFIRLFAVPGMGHCSGGPATSSYDDFGALVRWVEEDKAPASILATAPAGSPFAGRTRPLCPYPQYAKYKGGDIEQASSFRCEMPWRFTGKELEGFDD
jgi:feruloyl esterase